MNSKNKATDPVKNYRSPRAATSDESQAAQSSSLPNRRRRLSFYHHTWVIMELSAKESIIFLTLTSPLLPYT